MYKIQICSKKHDDFGILVNPREYVVNSAEEVCDILIALSSVYKTVEDLSKKKILLRAPINCPDTFEFQACVLMFKNMFPNCVVHFSA